LLAYEATYIVILPALAGENRRRTNAQNAQNAQAKIKG
jgi:hypothetical protein